MGKFPDFFKWHSTEVNKKLQTAQTLPEAGKSAPKEKVPKIRLAFMGTPQLAADILEALYSAGYQIVGVVTKADRPQGRGQEVVASPVKTFAQKAGLPLLQPQTLDENAQREIERWRPDLILVVAYGRLLPKELLKRPGFGCLNIHPSLLPKYRGASPLQNALLNGETETGVTLMQLDEGMDTGPLIGNRKVTIDPEDTLSTLIPKVTEAAIGLTLELLPGWVRRTIQAVPQDHSQATVCQLIEREDGHVLWDETAQAIYNRYRALTPWPGLFSFWRQESGLIRLKLTRLSLDMKAPKTDHALGTVFEIGDRIAVATAEGLIFIEELQQEGRKTLSVRDFLLGNPTLVGAILQ
ncbi:MAG: methionyl-tRNA formyltransferase [Candidatus Moraniibacteriota bacterium]